MEPSWRLRAILEVLESLLLLCPLGLLDVLLREACKSHICEMSPSVKEEWLLPAPPTFRLAHSSFVL